MSRYFHILLVICLVLTPGVAQSGSIVLKNGHVINGNVIVSDDEKVIMTWGNGRTTIYHRFIESVSLTEEEELAVRRYRSARETFSAGEPVELIELPDFSELHAPDPVKDDEEDDSTSEVVTPITEDLHEASSGVEALDPTLPTMERHEFASLGFSVDLPLTWAVSEYKDSVSIRSDCEEVMIAVDRYTVGLMTADRAALGLQVTLNEQGFEQDQNGMIHYLAHLDPEFSVESLTPDSAHHSVHVLMESDSVAAKSLVSVYWLVEGDKSSDELLASVLASLAFSAIQN